MSRYSRKRRSGGTDVLAMLAWSHIRPQRSSVYDTVVLRLRAPAEVGLAGGLGLVHAADPRVMRGAADEVAVLLGLSGDGPHGGDELGQRLLSLRLGGL